MSYAILRPAVIFGQEDILINNIAFFLRYFPVFPVPGDGKYKLQPIYVEDLAKLAIEWAMKTENVVIDAIGPETFTFNELLATLKSTLKSRTVTIHMPPVISFFLSTVLGAFLGDIVLTREEVIGLMDNLLLTGSPPAGDRVDRRGHRQVFEREGEPLFRPDLQIAPFVLLRQRGHVGLHREGPPQRDTDDAAVFVDAGFVETGADLAPDQLGVAAQGVQREGRREGSHHLGALFAQTHGARRHDGPIKRQADERSRNGGHDRSQVH